MKDVLIEDFKQITERNIPWNELRDKTFLITGATGLVGSLLVKCLLYANQTMNLNAKIYAVVLQKRLTVRMNAIILFMQQRLRLLRLWYRIQLE